MRYVKMEPMKQSEGGVIQTNPFDNVLMPACIPVVLQTTCLALWRLPLTPTEAHWDIG